MGTSCRVDCSERISFVARPGGTQARSVKRCREVVCGLSGHLCVVDDRLDVGEPVARVTGLGCRSGGQRFHLHGSTSSAYKANGGSKKNTWPMTAHQSPVIQNASNKFATVKTKIMSTWPKSI